MSLVIDNKTILLHWLEQEIKKNIDKALKEKNSYTTTGFFLGQGNAYTKVIRKIKELKI